MIQRRVRWPYVPHEITLVARGRSAAGYVIVDVVETSYKNASFFARKWMRDLEINAIAAVKPGKPWIKSTFRELGRDDEKA